MIGVPGDIDLWRGARRGASQKEIAEQFGILGDALRIESFEILDNVFEVEFHFAGNGLDRVSITLADLAATREIERVGEDLRSLLSEKYGLPRKRKSDVDIGEWVWENGDLKVSMTLVLTPNLETLAVDYVARRTSELDKI